MNALVMKKSNSKLRICLNSKNLNNKIKREYFQILSVKQITSKLTGAKYYSTLDTTSGFYQIKLNEESSKSCTFGKPFGRYQFLRLPYGIKAALEVFQERFKNIFNIERVEIYIDDILIWVKQKKSMMLACIKY